MSRQNEEQWIASLPSERPLGEDYWLCHCEGYRVTSRERRLGVVEDVLFGRSLERPDLLLVRGGILGRKLAIVPVERVEQIVPREQRIVLATEAAREA